MNKVKKIFLTALSVFLLGGVSHVVASAQPTSRIDIAGSDGITTEVEWVGSATTLGSLPRGRATRIQNGANNIGVRAILRRNGTEVQRSGLHRGNTTVTARTNTHTTASGTLTVTATTN